MRRVRKLIPFRENVKVTSSHTDHIVAEPCYDDMSMPTGMIRIIQWKNVIQYGHEVLQIVDIFESTPDIIIKEIDNRFGVLIKFGEIPSLY